VVDGSADAAKLFYRMNLRESRTNTRIANLTAEVTRLTQRDSASMITIAAVTMFFLPGTFVSVSSLPAGVFSLRTPRGGIADGYEAVLSTTFFDFGDHNLAVSSQWWIFPAAVIPLTVVVFGVWYAWLRLRIRRDNAAVREKEEKNE
jgi:hypothetical protein